MTNVHELVIKEKVLSLSPRELDVLRLVSLGQQNLHIAKHLYLSKNTVKVHIRRIHSKLGTNGGRAALALFYVDHVLPRDRSPNYKSGEKLAIWRERAEELRAKLKAAGVLRPHIVAAAMLLANPEHAGKNAKALGALLGEDVGGPASEDGYKHYLRPISQHLPEGGGMVSIAVIARLAPLDAA